MDIPEYYNLIKELFSPEEAAVFNAIPKGYQKSAGNCGWFQSGRLLVILFMRMIFEGGLDRLKGRLLWI